MIRFAAILAGAFVTSSITACINAQNPKTTPIQYVDAPFPVQTTHSSPYADGTGTGP